ncbi:MAG: NAD-dependent epimerase/dehydratase family protein [Thermoplasmataceae archaeon]
MSKILITGSAGQVGGELLSELEKSYNPNDIILTDISGLDRIDNRYQKFILDVRNYEELKKIIHENDVKYIFHLASILSAKGEEKPLLAFNVNMNGTENVLSASVELNVERVFIPSTIGVFGPEAPKDNTPTVNCSRPTTMYGISKFTAEYLMEYYFEKFNLDTRGIRYPGLLSYKTPPTAGTTDYAVDMILHAAMGKPYTCYLKPDAALPMMYMPDAMENTIRLFNAPNEKLRFRGEYNISAFTFTPQELSESIKEFVADFKVDYKPDYRQKIAETWPKSLDCSDAIKDWGFKTRFTLKEMIENMILNMRQ